MARKVLFTASSYSHICNFHLPYLEYFRNGGWQVDVACGGEQGEIPFADRVIYLPFKKKMQARENFAAARMLRREIIAQGYDLVAAHTSLAAFFTRLAVKGLRRRPRIVNVAHGYLFCEQERFTKNAVLLAAEKLVARETDLLLVMNGWDKNAALRQHLAKRIEMIPGIGINFAVRCTASDAGARQRLRAEYAIAENAFVLFYAAEFSARKSQETLIRAMAQLPENVCLVLAGDGALREACEETAQALSLSQRVLFPGYIADVSAWYACADAAVSASRSEGLPFNILEAMYCGLPVVASAVKGHTDLIDDEKTGLLYDYGDADACAKQIARLTASAALCTALGSAAKASVARYDLAQVLPQVLRAYESVLTDHV
ncbi:MAG: glycosyltransferase family 4 protein [Ruminococcaceae bacterium]|nr:glycosyltransferase family 4 protein [Oscillospiraceae bacterium]